MNCLDAETLAVWFDGALSGAALEDVRSHVAGCERCQALLGAMGRTRAAVPAPQPERSPRWWLAWAVPAAAAATAVAIWVLVPQPSNVAVTTPSVSSLQKQEAPPPNTARPALPERAEPAAPPATPATPTLQARAKEAEEAQDGARRESKSDAAQQAPATLNETSAFGAPPAAAPAQANESIRVLRDARVQPPIETLCRAEWSTPPVGLALTAGSSPSRTVCWVVGGGGVIARSTDGATWQRIAFPEVTDLSAVQASDAQTAIVTTADGRVFRTVDGGVTWSKP